VHCVMLCDVLYIFLMSTVLCWRMFRSPGVVVDMNRSKDKWKIVLDKHPDSYQWYVIHLLLCFNVSQLFLH